jgi:allantoicase
MNLPAHHHQPFADFVDLASARFGGAVLYANDDFFAEKENLVAEREPRFDPDRYTERGKWMDGWESRRRREPGNDWCVVRLGYPGRVRGVVVDTRFFVGNFPPEFALDGIDLTDRPDPAGFEAAELAWIPILTRQGLEGDRPNPFDVKDSSFVTHLRFSIYPDGGIARLRVYGEVDPPSHRRDETVDLAAMPQGGRVVGVSDDFFGHRHNLLLPGDSRGMFDGWETRRRRTEGNDWAVVRLGRPGQLRRAEIDTSWFRGNAPGACSLEAITTADWRTATDWIPILERTGVQADRRHAFDLLPRDEAWTHVRLNIYPDGGVARLRLWGMPA